MSTSPQTFMKEAPPDMTDTPASDTPAQNTPTPDQPEPRYTTSTQHNRPGDTITGTTEPDKLSAGADRVRSVDRNGVLITLFGSALMGLMLYTFNSINDRITTVETNLTAVNTNLAAVETNITAVNTNLAAVETNLTARIAAVNTNLAAVETNITARITAVETNLANLNGRVAAVETDLANLNGRMDVLGGQITELSHRQADMDESLSVLIAILNARREVEAAKAHQILPSPP